MMDILLCEEQGTPSCGDMLDPEAVNSALGQSETCPNFDSMCQSFEDIKQCKLEECMETMACNMEQGFEICAVLLEIVANACF